MTDEIAAKSFQALAKEAPFFPVTCRFRRVLRTNEETRHTLWPTSAEKFRQQFGNAANFFAGALEYVRLSTHWEYPYPELFVMVLNNKRPKSNGFAIYPPGLLRTKSGEIRILWAKEELTLTVFHELVHLFKGRESGEDWVEQQALKLITKIEGGEHEKNI